MKGGGEREGKREREREIHWTNSRALCEDNLKKKRGDGGFYRIRDKVGDGKLIKRIFRLAFGLKFKESARESCLTFNFVIILIKCGYTSGYYTRPMVNYTF